MTLIGQPREHANHIYNTDICNHDTRNVQNPHVAQRRINMTSKSQTRPLCMS